jgi:hypothetical protein
MAQILVAALTVLGAVLTIGGLAWGARKLLAEYRQLVDDLTEVQRLNGDTSLNEDERRAAKEAVLPNTSSWADVEYIRHWIRRFILEQATSGLGWPAALTIAGVVVSTAASVWSVWV